MDVNQLTAILQPKGSEDALRSIVLVVLWGHVM